MWADPYGIVDPIASKRVCFYIAKPFLLRTPQQKLIYDGLRDSVPAEAAFYPSPFTPVPKTAWKLQPIGFWTGLEKQGNLTLTNGCRPPSWHGGSQSWGTSCSPCISPAPPPTYLGGRSCLQVLAVSFTVSMGTTSLGMSPALQQPNTQGTQCACDFSLLH